MRMKINIDLKGVVIKDDQVYSLKDKVIKNVRPDKNIIEGYLKPFLKEQTIHRGELLGFNVEVENTKQFYTYDAFFKMIEERGSEKIDIFIEPVIQNQQKKMDEVITDFIQGNLPKKEKRDFLESLESTSGSTYVEGEFEDGIVIDVTKKHLKEPNISISEDLIQLINAEIQNDERNREPAEHPGEYRSSRLNYGIPPENIKNEMQKFIAAYNEVLSKIEPIDLESEDAVAKIKDVVKKATDFHTQFVAIHPFSNCNGKVARVLANLMLDKAGLPLAPINHWSSAYQYYTGQYKKHSSDLLERVLLEAMVYDGIKIQKRPGLEETHEEHLTLQSQIEEGIISDLVTLSLEIEKENPVMEQQESDTPILEEIQCEDPIKQKKIIASNLDFMKMKVTENGQESFISHQKQIKDELQQEKEQNIGQDKDGSFKLDSSF